CASSQIINLLGGPQIAHCTLPRRLARNRGREIVKYFVGFLGFLVLLVTLAVLGGAVYADPIGPNCPTCQGSIYWLTYNPTPEGTGFYDPTPNSNPHDNHTPFSIYDVTLTIDTSGYNAGGAFIDTVAIKATSTKQDATLGSGLDAAPGGVGAWTFHPGGLNAGGCDGSGAGFECAHDGTSAPVGGTLSWKFDVFVR